MLETQDTVLDSRRHHPSASCRSVVIALGLAMVILGAALALALVRNSALQKRAVHAERVADERGEEVRQLARQCGLAARISLEKLSQPEDQESDDQVADDEPALDAGIDTGHRVERW